MENSRIEVFNSNGSLNGSHSNLFQHRVYFGAGDRTRTGTGFRPGDFKSPTSTNSITPAPISERIEDSQSGG